MDIFIYHVGFMAAGSLLLMAGIGVVLFLRQKRSWLKLHRGLGLAGASLMAAGLVAAILMVQGGSGVHLGKPHTWIGAITVLGAILGLALGFLQFQFRRMAPKLRMLHRWTGRIVGILAVIAILTGLLLAGIF